MTAEALVNSHVLIQSVKKPRECAVGSITQIDERGIVIRKPGKRGAEFVACMDLVEQGVAENRRGKWRFYMLPITPQGEKILRSALANGENANLPAELESPNIDPNNFDSELLRDTTVFFEPIDGSRGGFMAIVEEPLIEYPDGRRTARVGSLGLPGWNMEPFEVTYEDLINERIHDGCRMIGVRARLGLPEKS